MPINKVEGEKKDGLQKYRVRVNYIDRFGKYRQAERTAYGIDEAKRIEMELTNSSKGRGQSKSMTVQALYDEYIAAKKHEVRETTLDKAERILQTHILPELKDVKLKNLSAHVLQKWKLTIDEKGLALTTRKKIYSVFRAMINYAVKIECIPTNPLIKVGNFKDAYQEKKEIQYYAAEEFKKFIAAAKLEAETKGFYEWNYYVFFNIAFYTGLRKGEIHALKWTDIEGDILHVRRSIAQKLKGGDRETPPKNKSSVRDLQLPEPLKRILEAHYARYKDVDGFSDDWRICGGVQCLRDSSINNRNQHYAKLAGVKTIRIHDFRHSHASLLANEGINIQEIARRLGHSNVEITWNTYSHLYPREEERAINILNKIE